MNSILLWFSVKIKQSNPRIFPKMWFRVRSEVVVVRSTFRGDANVNRNKVSFNFLPVQFVPNSNIYLLYGRSLLSCCLLCIYSVVRYNGGWVGALCYRGKLNWCINVLSAYQMECASPWEPLPPPPCHQPGVSLR